LSLTESFDVVFRHIAIPTNSGAVTGICLGYNKKEEAESFFNFIHQYLSASGQIPRRLVEVRATRESESSYDLTIEVGLGDLLRRIEITGIPAEYIESIRDSLKVFTYYLVVASYDLPDSGVTLLPLSENHLFLNRIIVDGEIIAGSPDCTLPWSQLVQSQYIVCQPYEQA
jgi:hypothetical protein